MAVTGKFIADGVNIRSGPYLNRTVLGQGYRGQTVVIHCEGMGEEVDDFQTWYYLTNNATGVTGWASWPGRILIDSGADNPTPC